MVSFSVFLFYLILFSPNRYRSPEPSIEEEALHKNEEALARASENATAKVNHISNNASAGLLIPTTRTLSISFSKPVVTTSSQPSTESTSINVSNSSISFTTPDSSSVLQGPYQPQTSLFSVSCVAHLHTSTYICIFRQ